MKFLRSVKDCARLGRIRNNDIRGKLGVKPVTKLNPLYKGRLRDSIIRISLDRISKLAMSCKPVVNRNIRKLG